MRASRANFDALQKRVRDLAPEEHVVLDSPPTISNDLFDALRHVVHDVGGQPDRPMAYNEEKEEADWEARTYVT